MTDFSLWDEVGGMYYAPQAGGGWWGEGEGKGIILYDRQEIFISYTFKVECFNRGRASLHYPVSRDV